MGLFLKGDVQRDRAYIALSVPRAPLLASIVLPDGRLAADAGASIYTSCSAVLEEPGRTAWRTLPIGVSARLDGFQTLEFEYRLGDPLPVRCLKPDEG